VDLSLAMAGQVELSSLIASQSLTSDHTRLLADLVAAIQNEMKLTMDSIWPSLTISGIEPSLTINNTESSTVIN